MQQPSMHRAILFKRLYKILLCYYSYKAYYTIIISYYSLGSTFECEKVSSCMSHKQWEKLSQKQALEGKLAIVNASFLVSVTIDVYC